MAQHPGRESRYTTDSWAIIEEQFNPETYYGGESIFALGNGYIGMRGSFEEGLAYPEHPNRLKAGSPETQENELQTVDGTYINGFYESQKIEYPEPGHAYAEYSQTMLNVPNGKSIRVRVGDGDDAEALHIDTGEILHYRRMLDMQAGLLHRKLTWRSPRGRELTLETRRLVSFAHPHLAAIEFRLTPHFDAPITIEALLDGAVENVNVQRDPRVGSHLKGCMLRLVGDPVLLEVGGALVTTTRHSRLALVSAMASELESATAFTSSPLNASSAAEDEQPPQIGARYTGQAQKDQPITLRKYLVYITVPFAPPASLDARLSAGQREALDDTLEMLRQASREDLRAATEEELASAVQMGFEGLARQQRAFLDVFWRAADVTIEGRKAAGTSRAQQAAAAEAAQTAGELQAGVRFNMFHLLQAAGNTGSISARETKLLAAYHERLADPQLAWLLPFAATTRETSVGAKGLTGEGYEGHYFWDTEMFVVPFFQYTQPEISRRLLEYRYSTLQQARARARELAHPRGAAYPWRTINGDECSAFFLGGTSQYHINADIAYAIRNYVAASGDTRFLIEMGAEIVFETARLWADLGDYVPARGNQFCIHGVTGPDEYTALVDNNCYTNMMAQEHLRYACAVAQWLHSTDPHAYTAIAGRLRLSDKELQTWAQAADNMYIPYDAHTGLFAQDDGFFHRASWRWDWGTRDGKSALLNRYHYLVVYRHQVCKQADVLLALYLLNDREDVNMEKKRRNFNYYEQITTHDSSLSKCTFSIVASEIGYHERAYSFFNDTVRMDLDDGHGNVTAGVHIANMAGAWMSVVNGFAGLRLEPGVHPGDGVPHYKPTLPDQWEAYSFKVNHRDCVLEVTVKRDPEQPVQVVAGYTLLPDGGQNLTLKHYGSTFTLSAENPTYIVSLS